MSIIKVYNYNNFFNRIVKKENTLANYGTPLYTITNCNFDTGDGVYTTMTLGTSNYNGDGNYVIETDSNNNILSRWFIIDHKRTRRGQYIVNLKKDLIVEFYNTVINAPCFINKAMVAENNPLIFNSEGSTYNQIKKQEILLMDGSQTPWIVGYIQKKSLSLSDIKYYISSRTGSHVFSDISSVDRVIVHSEDSAGNSYDVELSEKGTYDTYGYTWNVGTQTLTWSIMQTLLGTNYLIITAGIDKNINISYYEEPTEYIDAEDLPWTFNPNDTSIGQIDGSLSLDMFAWNKVTGSTGRQVSFGALLTKNSLGTWTPSSTSSIWLSAGTVQNADNSAWYPLYSNQYDITSGTGESDFKWAVAANFMISTPDRNITDEDVKVVCKNVGFNMSTADPTSYNGKIIKYNGVYYDISVGSLSHDYHVYNIDKSTDSVNGLYTKIHVIYRNIASAATSGSVTWTEQSGSNDALNQFRGTFYSNSYPVTITRHPLTVRTNTLTIPDKATRTATMDAPYDIFAIPYNQVQIENAQVLSDTDIVNQLILELPLQLGSNLYDLQLLPYCPIREAIVGPNHVTEIGAENYDYTYIKNESGDVKGIVYFCKLSKGTFDIPISLTIGNYSANANINKKIDSETVNYRLVSPNYNGQFEFKVSYNNANITTINVDYEYKPYIPYIHLSPVWDANGLYGGDYNDARGLICGGDFSLPILTDSWTQYQINNKNYQTIFDRQIQNMQDVHEQQVWDAGNRTILNTLTGAVGGAAVGAKVGGGWGALAGSVVGTASGLAGGLLDEYSAQKYYNIQESYTKDTFRLQLGNIKALPYSLAKVSSLNNNNKLFPFLEKYEATEAEVQALINKITYTSMTVGAVGTIANYIDANEKHWLSGEILIMDNLGEDSLLAGTIYEEIKKGVYI